MSSVKSTVLQLLAVLAVVVIAVAGDSDRTRGRLLGQPTRQVSPIRPPVPQPKAVASRYELRAAAKKTPVKQVARASNSDSIIFPTDPLPSTTGASLDGASTVTSSFNTSNGLEIPLSLLQEMYKISDPKEFITKYGSQGRSSSSISGRTNPTLLTAGVSVRERTIGESPEVNPITSIPYAIQAVCTPQPTTVPFDLDNEPYVTYFPACTRLDRCGGCCPHHLLECAASKSQMVTLQVLKTRYLGPGVNKFDIAEPVVVKMEQHLECQCQCRVQASHCSAQQVYRPNECRCECLNPTEAAACAEADKFWDAGNCVCRCREHIQCSTGFHFNKETCTCDLTRDSRKSPVVARPSANFGFRDFE